MRDIQLYHRYPTIISHIYILFEKFFKVIPKRILIENLIKLQQKVFSSISYLIDRIKNKTFQNIENQLGIYISIILLNFFDKYDIQIKNSIVEVILTVLQIFVEYVIKKQNIKFNQHIFDQFDPQNNENYLDIIFKNEDLLNYISNNHHILIYYKGYLIILLRLIIKNSNNFLYSKNFKTFNSIFIKIYLKFSS